jgi:mono/diheme cytochrome c family protein
MTGARLLAVALAAALPCAAAADPGQLAARARRVLEKHCAACHGAGPQARAGLHALEREALVKRGVIRPQRPQDSELVQLVECGTMPPGRRPKLTDPDVAALRDWIGGGAPDWKVATPPDPVLLAIAADLRSLSPGRRALQRYVSFHHLGEAVSPDTCADALTRALNLLSQQKEPVWPTPLQQDRRVFRIDLKQLGWDENAYQADKKDNPAGVESVNLFDLLLLEYPAPPLPDLGGDQLQALADYLERARPVRPVVYVRGDWLLAVALRPPLYDDLLQLPRSLGELTQTLNVPSGDGQTVWAGLLQSQCETAPGVRLVYRWGSKYGFFWQTADLPERGKTKLLHYALKGPAQADKQALFSLPNGLPGFFTSQRYQDWRRAPAFDGAAAKAIHGGDCLRCHLRGPVLFTDAVRKLADEPQLNDNDSKKLRQNYAGQLQLEDKIKEDRQTVEEALERIHKNGIPPADPMEALTHRPQAPLRPAPGDLVPLDGLLFPTWEGREAPARLQLPWSALNPESGEETTTFHPNKEKMVLRLKNNTGRAVHFELIQVDGKGSARICQPPRPLGPGKTYVYPKEDAAAALTASEFLGTDLFVLYASFDPLPAGVLLKSVRSIPCGTDRVVHRWYDWPPLGKPAPNLSGVLKTTLPIRTVE